MINTTRPILNLDLDLLRTFVAVADLNTFAAAAAAVCRTQSAVSQQMQRLEQLVGKELFARHGRNKLLTEQGIQLLGYAFWFYENHDRTAVRLHVSENNARAITFYQRSGFVQIGRDPGVRAHLLLMGRLIHRTVTHGTV